MGSGGPFPIRNNEIILKCLGVRQDRTRGRESSPSRAGLQRPFAFEIFSEAVHQISAERPAFRLLGRRIGKMASDLL